MVDLFQLAVVPQVQHLVVAPDPDPLPEPDASHPEAQRWAALLRRLDVDGDGRASRRDMLVAFRRDRQLADHLRMPHEIKMSDGSFDKFISQFIAINRDGMGKIDDRELFAHMLATRGPSSGAYGGYNSEAGSCASTPGRRPDAVGGGGSPHRHRSTHRGAAAAAAGSRPGSRPGSGAGAWPREPKTPSRLRAAGAQ